MDDSKDETVLERFRRLDPVDDRFWSKIDLVTLEEAVFLYYGIDPTALGHSTFPCGDNLIDRLDEEGICKLMGCSIESGGLKVNVKYKITVERLCKWLESKELKIPQCFHHQKAANETPQKKTSKSSSSQLEESERFPRESELDKSACQAIARILWELDSNRTIEDICEHNWIQIYGNGKLYTGKHTIRNWIKDLDPRPPEEKVGRPRKNKN